MNRTEFVKSCGWACLGISIIGLDACTATKMISATIEKDEMIIPLDQFENHNGQSIIYRSYVIGQNDLLQYPICIYRLSAKEYKALYMRCSHQGTELTAFGDKLKCSAHGSEFDTFGLATNGPAEKALRTFPVIIEPHQLKISLKAI